MDTFDGLQAACGNFQVFLLNDEQSGYLQISLDARNYDLKKDNEFNLAEEPALSVRYKKFDRDISSQVCNDIMPPVQPKLMEQDIPTSGKVIIKLSERNWHQYKEGAPYEIDILLIDVEFEGGTISKHLKGLTVGWMPG